MSAAGLTLAPSRSRNPRTAAKLTVTSHSRPIRMKAPRTTDAALRATVSHRKGSASSETDAAARSVLTRLTAPPTMRIAAASSTAGGLGGEAGFGGPPAAAASGGPDGPLTCGSPRR